MQYSSPFLMVRKKMGQEAARFRVKPWGYRLPFSIFETVFENINWKKIVQFSLQKMTFCIIYTKYIALIQFGTIYEQITD